MIIHTNICFISPISITCLNAIQECALNDSASAPIHFEPSIGGYLHELFCNRTEWNQIVGIFAALAVLALILLLHLSFASTASFFHSAKNVQSLFFCNDFIKYFDRRLNPKKQVRFGQFLIPKINILQACPTDTDTRKVYPWTALTFYTNIN